jgi:outer membrane protein assembly factor BamB
MSPHFRRALLRSLAAGAAALGGCSGGESPSTRTTRRTTTVRATSSTTRTETETAETTAETTETTQPPQDRRCDQRWEPGKQWSFRTGSGVFQPVVADGVVYVGSDDGRFYAVDAATGEEGGEKRRIHRVSRLRWQVTAW